ncbi:uncharacterized protein IWZ02DRAFT_140011 [Phyllosticta citriasiana]|uniref:uncharacterized protein n=1 Tax=Phyllosticta citriasiana TaxID=595635 RepID=UPI0030FD576A
MATKVRQTGATAGEHPRDCGREHCSLLVTMEFPLLTMTSCRNQNLTSTKDVCPSRALRCGWVKRRTGIDQLTGREAQTPVTRRARKKKREEICVSRRCKPCFVLILRSTHRRATCCPEDDDPSFPNTPTLPTRNPALVSLAASPPLSAAQGTTSALSLESIVCVCARGRQLSRISEVLMLASRSDAQGWRTGWLAGWMACHSHQRYQDVRQ